MSPAGSEKTGARVWRDFPVVFDEARILRRLGVRKRPEQGDLSLIDLVREETAEASRLLAPAAAAAVVPSGGLEPHDVFAGALSAGLCICTIGPGIEQRAARFMAEHDLLRGLVLDALGTEAVSAVSRNAEARLGEWGRALGLHPGKRYAPGYKGWDVSGQKTLFDRLPAGDIGVGLTDGFMMVPRKSYSFRINFCSGPDPGS
jgi:hypothetical protein